ncbi:hypothetical protein R3Q06_27345 [Rhodococcus erythropolis]|uniref:hypothetical protein n=1 Tax=Rhodococcus erythropolis TaxID=1833 RepID=UPI002949827C|nr:hypothetical protein [Rhodococcus erythropolis]MDV6277215.1 hypothetical protein [Rhodococcus erythropolis]
MNTSPTRHRIKFKKTLHSTVGIIAVAAAICTGTGISSATTTDPATTAALPSSAETIEWSVQNLTGQSIYGQWDAWNSNGKKSHVAATANDPWYRDETASTKHDVGDSSTYWSGRTCYNEQFWDFYPTEINEPIVDGRFKLEADSKGALHVRYKTRRNYFFTQETIFYNETLAATGLSC